jgi:hypothetical protein
MLQDRKRKRREIKTFLKGWWFFGHQPVFFTFQIEKKILMESKTAMKKYVAELHEIRKHHRGALKPRDVVDTAADFRNPLHSYFEWNNEIAGDEYRLHQARQLIANVVEYMPNEKSGGYTPTRAFISLTTERHGEESGYRTIKEVLSREDLRKQMLKDALNELNAVRLKYSTLKELAKVFEEIDNVKRSL